MDKGVRVFLQKPYRLHDLAQNPHSTCRLNINTRFKVKGQRIKDKMCGHFVSVLNELMFFTFNLLPLAFSFKTSSSRAISRCTMSATVLRAGHFFGFHGRTSDGDDGGHFVAVRQTDNFFAGVLIHQANHHRPEPHFVSRPGWVCVARPG